MTLYSICKVLPAVLLTTFTFFFTTGDLRAQLRQVHLDETANNNSIYKISFYAVSSGYVAFEDCIGYTTDTGRTFTKKFITAGNVNFNGYGNVNLTFGFGINGVKAFNQSNLIVYGHYGLVPAILYSGNGGNSFTLVFHSQFNSQQLRTGITDMSFPQNNSTGFATDADRILKTIDGGVNWTAIAVYDGSYFTNIEAVDNSNMYALSTGFSSNKLLKTVDGGNNWTTVNLPILPGGKMLYATFISASAGWLNMLDNTQKGYFYKTNDGGNSWTLINNIAVASFTSYKLKFLDANTGYALTEQNIVQKTTDGGVIWEPLARDNNYSYLGYTHNDLFFWNLNQFWAGGQHRFLELSTNAGGIPLPKAYFNVDTSGYYNTDIVNLVNYSKPGYTVKWIVNNVQISTTPNAFYIHELSRLRDTITLIVSNGVNTDSTTKYQAFDPPVIITSFTPATAGGGSTVIIKGKNFTGANAVSFGNVPALGFTVTSDTIINALVGQGATGNVRVTKPGSTRTLPGFVFIPPPTIGSFTPTTATAGTLVTITGTNFTGASAVTFGGIPAASYTLVSSTSITAVVPSGVSGNVQVTTPGGTAFLSGFVILPVVNSFSPLQGTTGTILHITGTSFTSAVSVKTGGTNVISFTINSSTSITAIVGTGSTGSISVSLPGGTSSLPGFTWYPPPVITSFTPSSGPVGTSVTITGSGFNGTPAGNIVRFGSVSAAITAASPTSLTVIVPAGALFEPISVTSNFLTGYSRVPFTVTFANGGSITTRSFDSTGIIPLDTINYGPRMLLRDFDKDGKNDIGFLKNGTFILNSGAGIIRNSGTAGNLQFDPPVTLFGALESMAAADLDGDGKDDVVLAAGRDINVYRNKSAPGTIAFDTLLKLPFISTSSATEYTSQVCLADIDGDGKTDIICSGRSLEVGINVFKNVSEPGAVAFKGPINISRSTISSKMLIATDLTGDNKPEIIMDGYILKNNSTPVSISFVTTSVHINLNYFTTADIDGDGQTDIAGSSTSLSNFSILRNTSNSNNVSFDPPVDLPAAIRYPGFVTACDLDGDGKVDLTGLLENYQAAFCQNKSTPGNISFAAPVYYRSGLYWQERPLTSGDIDNDGKNDIIMATSYTSPSSAFSVLRNTVQPEPFIASFTPFQAVTGDIITITGKNFTGVTSVSFGNVAAASFTVTSSTSITATVGAGASGDVTVTNAFGTYSVQGFVYGFPVSVTSVSPLSAAVNAVVSITGNNFNNMADSNIVLFGNVKAKVLSASAVLLTVRVPFGSVYAPITVTTNQYTAASPLPFTTTFIGGAPSFISNSFATRCDFAGIAASGCVSDIDGDNKLDIIANLFGGLGIGRNTSITGNLSFETAKYFNTGISGKPATGDLDGDGREDIAVSIGNRLVTILRNTSSPGNITLASPVNVTGSNVLYPPDEEGITIKDLDMDGKPELLLTGSEISIFRNKSTRGNIAFEARVGFSIGNDIFTMDMDGDNKPEIVSTYNSTASFAVALNKCTPGTISFAAPLLFPNTAGKICIADMNIDGKPDIMLVKQDSILMYRNTSTVGTVSFVKTVMYVGPALNPAWVGCNDLDGDGKPELFAAYKYNSTLAVFKNTSNAGAISLLPKTSYPITGRTTTISSADMDSDGKADLVIFNTDFDYGSFTTVLRNQSGGNSPSVFSFSPVNAVQGTPVTITGSGLAETVGVSFGNVPCDSFFINSDNQITAFVGAGASGNVIVSSASGMGSLQGFTYTTAPAIASFSPTVAIAGSIISIEGANLDGTTAVSFGGVAADSFIVHSSGSITAWVNRNSQPGVVKIKKGTDSAFKAGFLFYYPATVTSCTPMSGFQNTIVNITGQQLAGTSAVSFGGMPAASFSFIAPDTLRATVSAGSSGNITVTTPAGNVSIAGFYYQAAPAMISFFPSVATRGSTVTITGTNLAGVTEVKFGGINARSFLVTSPSTITAVVDSGASGSISVTNANGTSTLPGFTFLDNATPGIISFSPAVVTQGMTVHINGMGFNNVTGITVGGAAVASFTVLSSTLISAVMPVTTSGNIVITTGTGSASIAGLVYSTAPVITDFYPTSARMGATINIYGGNFNSTPSSNIVYFGVVRAVVQAATEKMLSVIVPAGAVYNKLSVTAGNLTGYSSKYFLPSFSSAGSFDQNSFSLRIDSIAGDSPNAVCLADIDNDSKTDLSANNYNSNNSLTSNISLFRNTSIPNTVSLAAKSTITEYNTAENYFTDFNGDGLLDLLTAFKSGYPITARLNTSTPGNINFGSPTTLQMNGYSDFKAASADFDYDGKPDIVLLTTSGPARIFRNTSTPSSLSFSNSIDIATGGGNKNYPLVEDIDLDGKTDLIVAGFGRLAFYKNTSTPGNISFTLVSSFSTTYQNLRAAFGDFDNDGKIDIAYATINKLTILKNISNTGHFAFETQPMRETVAYPSAIAVSDLDGNGKADLAITDETLNTLAIFSNISKGSQLIWAEKKVYPTSSPSSDIDIADIDLDGKPDIVLAHPKSNSVSIIKNTITDGAVASLLCAGSSTSFNSGITGTGYQWQVNTGNGFVNITNNSNYTGATGSILQLMNVPSNWYGYTYRCRSGNRFSPQFRLKFENTWIGLVNSNWENPANWSCNLTPDRYTDIRINGGTIILNTTGFCRSFMAGPAVSFTVTPGNQLIVAQ